MGNDNNNEWNGRVQLFTKHFCDDLNILINGYNNELNVRVSFKSLNWYNIIGIRVTLYH